jgi:hypothetical protein
MPLVPFERASRGPDPEPGTAKWEQLYAEIHRELKPRTEVPLIRVRFRRFANANSFIQLKHGAIEVRITDVLADAPTDVQEALAYLLLSKLFRRPVPPPAADRYRRYLHRKEMRERIQAMRVERGRKELAEPQGQVYDLVEVFEQVNLEYFHGLMARPALGWSLRASRSTLGHYDPSHHTIVISRALDDARVPRFVVEFVMYHEMLHVRYPTEHCGGRRRMHTPLFRAEEQRFAHYAEAKAWMRHW